MSETGYETTYYEFGQILEDGPELWDAIEKITGYKFLEESDNFIKEGKKFSKLEVHKSIQADKKQQYLIYDRKMYLFHALNLKK